MPSTEKRVRDGQTAYVVRWREPDGRQRSRSFARKGDATRHETTVAADLVRGEYIDPSAG